MQQVLHRARVVQRLAGSRGLVQARVGGARVVRVELVVRRQLVAVVTVLRVLLAVLRVVVALVVRRVVMGVAMVVVLQVLLQLQRVVGGRRRGTQREARTVVRVLIT